MMKEKIEVDENEIELADSSFVQMGVIKFPEQRDHDNFTVTKSNKLISAQTLLSAREQKVLAACISLINPLAKYPNGISVELEDEHIARLTGLEKRHIYRFIDEAAKKLHSIPIETPGKKEGTISYINIAHKSEYDPDNRKLVIKFHEDMESELVQLSQYTSIELKYLVRMKSKYSIRLYEILSKQYSKAKGGTQYFKVRLDDLYFPLGLKDIKGGLLAPSYLRDFQTFKAKIIVPACKEISLQSNLDVDFSAFRAGRNIAGLTFSMKPSVHKIESEFGEFKLPALPNLLDIDEAIKYLEIKKIALDKWQEKYSAETIQSNVYYCLCRMEEGATIKNPAAYIAYLLKHNLADLPDVANPYSIKYKTNKDAHEFVKRVVVPIWWKLPEELREDLKQIGSFATHYITSKVYNAFVKTAKEESYDDAEVIYDGEYALEEWS